jgi:hypothetical protein
MLGTIKMIKSMDSELISTQIEAITSGIGTWEDNMERGSSPTLMEKRKQESGSTVDSNIHPRILN